MQLKGKSSLFALLPGLAALTVAAAAGAATVSIHPSMIVADDNGAILGPVIGFASNGRPLVLIKDPTEPNTAPRGVIVRVESSEDLSTEDDFEVFYSDPGCTGTAYLKPASERFGVTEMTNINYSVGLNGTDVVLYKGLGAGSNTPYESFYRSTTVSCSAASGSRSLVAATQIINFTNDHPAPYGVLFPGL